jgi:Asp-tRNA(Asn)/Glu-tRNA(Gln) amidotransferase A subunit family amidase
MNPKQVDAMPSNVQITYTLEADDLVLIEREHARLEHFLQRLSDTCSELETDHSCLACDGEKQACCQGRLTSFLYDFMDLVAEHFENEEMILCEKLGLRTEEYFQQHHAAHMKLMRELTDMIRDATELNRQGLTAEAIRQLNRWIQENFTEHARRYDVAFLPMRGK